MLRNPGILEVSKAKRGEKIRIGGFTPTFVRPKRGENCYVTPASWGVPSAKRGEKIRIGCLTPTVYGAHKQAELLRNPCNLRGPHTRGQNQNWWTYPCLLGAHKWAELLHKL